MPDEKEYPLTPNDTTRGPARWLLPVFESAYAGLIRREHYVETPEIGLCDVPQTVWLHRFREYKRRKLTAAGGKEWTPLGPSVVLEGQTHDVPPLAGRISGIAVAPGGQLVYAATANGGVFKSVDGGVSWRSCMDGPSAGTSLACGAIAIDANDPSRVYVGTGEGDTHSIFSNRVTKPLPAHHGIGPIRSDDGGNTWITENVAAGSPQLAGKAFFTLAVDPANRENVLAATSEGIYQRIAKADGSGEWAQRRSGVHSSVVATASGSGTRFYCAEWGSGVFQSTNGINFTRLGTNFPSANVGRIALAVQPGNANVVYAFIVNKLGALLGIYRFDGGSGPWKVISSAPAVLPADSGHGHGDYDVAIAVDPVDINIIYIGGGCFTDDNYNLRPSSIWRCVVRKSSSAYKMTGSSIGIHARAAVHALVHSPEDPDALWAGCDGGVFLNLNPRAEGTFQARNNGLACSCTTSFAQHPGDPDILFCCLQNNGTARTGAGSIWKHIGWGDRGCLINWADPDEVLICANATVFRSANGGQDHHSWTEQRFPWANMRELIVGPPYNPASPADARVVALAAGKSIHFSNDFGVSWDEDVAVPSSGGGIITATFATATFATATRLFVATAGGEVLRLDKAGSSWQVDRLDNAVTGPLGLHGMISGIAIDWADISLQSIYVAFGGMGDYRHVWHFDGTRWSARSGPAGDSGNLLDVQHSAVTVDRDAPDNVYAGADIGVWHSSDRGATWVPMPNGLPDAPVFDLQIHPARRLLRASTHGRGLYEFPL